MKPGEWLEIDIPLKIKAVKKKINGKIEVVAKKVQVPPCSENKLYATNWKTKRRFPTRAGEKWKGWVRQFVFIKSRPIQPGKGSEMYLEIFLTFPKLKRKRDPMNYLKPIADALKNILWDDDENLKGIADGEQGEVWKLKIRFGLKSELKTEVKA